MSAYDNVVGGKLKLKGKALDVKVGGAKKKKKLRKHHDQITRDMENEHPAGGSGASSEEIPSDVNEEEVEIDEGNKLGEDGKVPHYDDHLTPAENRYIEHKERINVHKLAKKANKSHRNLIKDFNQYLGNMSEHYDIPKVVPG